MKIYRVIITILIFFILTACTSTKLTPISQPKPSSTQKESRQTPPASTVPVGEATVTSPLPSTTLIQPTKTTSPILSPSPTSTSSPGLRVMPPVPQAVVFYAEDGQMLQGMYYAASVNPAPIIVLMHWAGGDQRDWFEIAYWLQNRGLGGNKSNPQNRPWLDSSWFPPLPEGKSFAVFTFTFRNCVGGCQVFEPDKWLLDARAAILKASQLEGVDPRRIVSVGASIGADGAPDSCYWLNIQSPNSCLGALSLSPGNYLTVHYPDAVKYLGDEQPPKLAWCLFSTQDPVSTSACNAANGTNYQKYEYKEDLHGMLLIQPGYKPPALQLLLDFLNLVFGS